MELDIVQNAALALQDHCCYKVPTTTHHIKKIYREEEPINTQQIETQTKRWTSSGVI